MNMRELSEFENKRINFEVSILKEQGINVDVKCNNDEYVILLKNGQVLLRDKDISIVRIFLNGVMSKEYLMN